MPGVQAPEQELLPERNENPAGTLIIADIHHEYERAQAILDSVPHDRAVFLGDYWDSWKHNSPEHARRTAGWLLKRMAEHPEDKFLIGNHDIQYLFINVGDRCGFTAGKYFAICDVLSPIQSFRRRLDLYTFVDGWLLTHAGLKLGMIGEIKDIPRIMENCRRQLEAGNSNYLIRDSDGILWCRKFVPVPGLKQVFGHTTRDTPYFFDKHNCCLDTDLQHYALIRNGELTVHKAPL